MSATSIQNILLGILIGVLLALGAPAIATHEEGHIDGERLTLTNDTDGATVNWLIENGDARADLKSPDAGAAFLFGQRVEVRNSIAILGDGTRVRLFIRGARLMAKMPGRPAVVVARF